MEYLGFNEKAFRRLIWQSWSPRLQTVWKENEGESFLSLKPGWQGTVTTVKGLKWETPSLSPNVLGGFSLGDCSHQLLPHQWSRAQGHSQCHWRMYFEAHLLKSLITSTHCLHSSPCECEHTLNSFTSHQLNWLFPAIRIHTECKPYKCLPED